MQGLGTSSGLCMGQRGILTWLSSGQSLILLGFGVLFLFFSYKRGAKLWSLLAPRLGQAC